MLHNTKRSRTARTKWIRRKGSDIQVEDVSLYYLPVTFRMPLKFGAQRVTSITCARVRIRVRNSSGQEADGWGEVPLSVPWAWPSKIPYAERFQRLQELCSDLAAAWIGFEAWGHALEVGHDFQQEILPRLMRPGCRPGSSLDVPYLAALMCCSPFDIALHDAYGNLNKRDIYTTYNAEFMNRDLSAFLTSADDGAPSFDGRFPEEFFVENPPKTLVVWHLVGGLDPLTADDLTGNEPNDGHPVLLTDWIKRDGLQCLKVKLRGNDTDWDYDRLVRVGSIACEHELQWLSADFNCMVADPAYVNDILDRLKSEHRRIFEMLSYVEQPFPYDLEKSSIDVRSVAARKPIYLDESAHDWKYVALGRQLGWSGVALKTCKTQTGALLSLCWAKNHGMPLMVQDLTNPMLAQIPHVRLASHTGTIMGVETNAMQFYPEASAPEAVIHPGLYQRRCGLVDLSTIAGTGFGYRINEIDRKLPEPFN